MKRARSLMLVVVATGLLATSASAKNGLAALRESKALDESARALDRDGREGLLRSPVGRRQQFFVRIERYYRSTGYSHWTVGENLLWRAPTVSAAQAMKLWIASLPHRKNLETAAFRDVGVSAVRVATARGVYRGQTVTIITTDFGVRSR